MAFFTFRTDVVIEAEDLTEAYERLSIAFDEEQDVGSYDVVAAFRGKTGDATCKEVSAEEFGEAVRNAWANLRRAGL